MSYGKALTYSKGKMIDFADFNLTFVETIYYQHPTATVSTNTQVFLAKPQKASAFEIKVVSGQLPPQPQDFFVGDQGFTLYTFKGPNGTRLEPNQLVVEKNTKVRPNKEDRIELESE